MKTESKFSNRALIESLPLSSPRRQLLERQDAERADKLKKRMEALKNGSHLAYQAGAMVRALDRGNIGFILRPDGPGTSYVRFYNSETGQSAQVKLANSQLELLAPPSERQARIQTLSVGSLERLKLEREETAAREGLAVFNAIEVPNAAMAVGSHVKAPGVAGAMGKTGFVEALDDKGKAKVRYYDGAGTPAQDLVTEDASKLKVLANPSGRMEALARMPEGVARDDMLRKEQEYRRGAAARMQQLASGKGGKGGGLDGLLRQAQHGLSVATREVVGGLSIESR